MKLKILFSLPAACIFFISTTLLGQPAFPGAEGWGASTPGGRGPDPFNIKPKVFVITNLNSYGPGSFNEALRSSGPRFIVFRVSGVIDLQPSGGGGNEWYLGRDNSSYVTIAGQTSPGGVTFKSSAGGTSIIFAYQSGFHDGIFRHLRFRAKIHNEDGLTMSDGNKFIFDHCDFSGASDETLDISQCNDFTVQWCTITNSSSGAGSQNLGFLIANYSDGERISIHHNLMAHHIYRFPALHWGIVGRSLPDNGKFDYRNNVCYNGSQYFFIANETTPKAEVQLNIVGNTFKAGPQSPPNGQDNAAWFYSMVDLGDIFTGYELDNVMINKAGQIDRNNIRQHTPNRVSTPWPFPEVTTQTADEAYEIVLNSVGAWPRDEMNARTVEEVRNETGQFGKTDDPLLWASGTAPEPPDDTDMDGISDDWENAHGLNPNDPSDSVEDRNGDGYLNIEEYINELAEELASSYVNSPSSPRGIKIVK